MKPDIISNSPEESKEFANILSKKISMGDILTLKGDLGAGKTLIAKNVISNISGIEADAIQSPTFSILQTYKTPRGFEIYHYDLYRLKSEEELYEIGMEDAFDKSKLVIIEWPEIASRIIPNSKLDIDIKIDQNSRILSINSNLQKRLYDK